MEIFLRCTETKMGDAVVRGHIGAGKRSSVYPGIVTSVECCYFFWNAKEGLEDEVETGGRVEISCAFEYGVEVRSAGDEVGFERSKSYTDWDREAKASSVASWPPVSVERSK